MRRFLLLCISLGFSFLAAAQCRVSFLNVNTGRNPANGTLYPIGSQDPYWAITGLSAGNQAVSANPVPFQSYVTTPNAAYASNANGGWLSFLSNPTYATAAGSDSSYITTYTRLFSNCDADTYTFTLLYGADNWLSGLFVDGISYYYQAPNGNTSNFNVYNPIPTFSVALSPGVHQISAAVFNQATTLASNPTAFSLLGTITGTTTSLLADTCTSGVASVSVAPHADTICAGGTVSLTATGSGVFTWSPAAGLNTTAGAVVNASPTVTTTYKVIATGKGCSIPQDSVLVVVVPKLTPSLFTTNSPICAGDSIKISATNANPAASFDWTGPAGFTANSASFSIPAAAVGNGGYYKLTTGVPFCTSTDSTNMVVDLPKATFTVSADTICQNGFVTFTNASTALTPAYTWNFGDSGTDNATDPTHYYYHQGTFLVTLNVTDMVPCFDSTKMYITVDSVGGINFATSDSVLCQGKAIVFKGTYLSLGNTGNVWNFGDQSQITNANPITHAYEVPGTYQVSLTAKYRVCPDTTFKKDITINAYPTLNLGADTSMCPNATAILLADFVNAGTPGAKWLWNTGDTSSYIYATQPGIYYATVTLKSCSTSDSVWVRNDCYLSIPNVFTPNNDGVNDYFFPRVRLSAGVTNFKMDIYNRWGETIFETHNSDGRGWDGKFNGQDQPEGVYIYTIDVQFKDGESETYKGNVTLLR